MVDVFIEWGFDPILTADEFADMMASAAPCLPLYRVNWVESLLADDGSRMVCHFESPDAEAVRMATRGERPVAKRVWSGTYVEARDEPANVVVERSFERPVTLEEIQAIEDGHPDCLQTYRVTYLRTFFSSDCKRMICLYRAPDAESVRRAQHEAAVPVAAVWSCRNFRPGEPQAS